MIMKTNFKELLTNTNLDPIEILKYYEEEIIKELEIYNIRYWSYVYLYGDYYDFIKDEKTEKIEEQKNKVVNLILEFTELVKYIVNDYYKKYGFQIEIKDLNDGLRYLNPREWAEETKESIKYIIQGLSNEINSSECMVKERLNISNQEKKDIEEFYIAELNRLLDEKEARIYELEDEQAKNEQEIDGLINENVCLRRIIELNSDDDGTY